jgi:hypothetical protein
MKLKQAILTAIDRDTLKIVTENLEMEGVDRRSPKAMHEGLACTRRVAPEILQGRYSDIRRVNERWLSYRDRSHIHLAPDCLPPCTTAGGYLGRCRTDSVATG